MDINEGKLIAMLRTDETDAKLNALGLDDEEIRRGREVVKNLNIDGHEALTYIKSLIQRMAELDHLKSDARSKI